MAEKWPNVQMTKFQHLKVKFRQVAGRGHFVAVILADALGESRSAKA